MNVFLEGLGLGFSLIVAIGAQNAFVLRQGIKGEHVFATALLCALIDFSLISAGALGLGSLVSSHPTVLRAVTFLGAAFVVWYGIHAFIRVFKTQALTQSKATGDASLKTTLFALLAISLLNPHVYLDTVLLLGSVSSRHPLPARYLFVAGASSASFAWFFSISYGARLLAPLFERRITWRIFDFVIGVVMIAIAVQLARFGIVGW